MIALRIKQGTHRDAAANECDWRQRKHVQRSLLPQPFNYEPVRAHMLPQGGDKMAITLFLVLNGISVVFLLYVLTKFWAEGHRSGRTLRKYEVEFGTRNWSNHIVETHAISRDSSGRRAVIPFPLKHEVLQERTSRGAA
jgi:hypothetical protein